MNGINSLETARPTGVEAIALRVAGTVVLISDATDISQSNGIGAEVQVRPIRGRVIGAEPGRVPLQLSTGDDIVAVTAHNFYAAAADRRAFDPKRCK